MDRFGIQNKVGACHRFPTGTSQYDRQLLGDAVGKRLIIKLAHYHRFLDRLHLGGGADDGDLLGIEPLLIQQIAVRNFQPARLVSDLEHLRHLMIKPHADRLGQGGFDLNIPVARIDDFNRQVVGARAGNIVQFCGGNNFLRLDVPDCRAGSDHLDVHRKLSFSNRVQVESGQIAVGRVDAHRNIGDGHRDQSIDIVDHHHPDQDRPDHRNHHQYRVVVEQIVLFVLVHLFTLKKGSLRSFFSSCSTIK